MSFSIGRLDQDARIREKQESRAKDSARLKGGQVSREQLKRENNPFSGLGLSGFKIAAIGDRKIVYR